MKDIEQTESFEKLDNLSTGGAAKGLRGLDDLSEEDRRNHPNMRKWKNAVKKLPKKKKTEYYEKAFQESKKDRKFQREQILKKEIRPDTQIVHFWLGENIVKEEKLEGRKENIIEIALSEKRDDIQIIGVPEKIDIDYSEIKNLPVAKYGVTLLPYKDGFLIVSDNNPKGYNYFEISNYSHSKAKAQMFFHTISLNRDVHYYLRSDEVEKVKNHKDNLNLYFVFKRAYKNKAFKITLKNNTYINHIFNLFDEKEIDEKKINEIKNCRDIFSSLPNKLLTEFVEAMGVLEHYEELLGLENEGNLTEELKKTAIKFSKERILKSGYYYSVVSKLTAIVVMINSVLKNTPQAKKSKELKKTILEGFQDLDPNDYKILTKTLLAAMEEGDLDPKSVARFVEKGICSGKFVKKDGSFDIMELTQKLVNLIISYKHTEEGTSLPIVGKIGLEKATDVDCFHYWSYINSFNLVNGCLDKRDFPLLLNKGKIFNEQELYKHATESKNNIGKHPFQVPSESFNLDPETKTKISEILKEAMEQTTGLLIPYNACIELLDDPVFKYIRFIEYEKYIAIFAHDQSDRFISEMYVKGEDEFRYWLYNSGQVFDSKVTESSKHLYLKLASSIRDWKILIERDSTMQCRGRRVPTGVKSSKRRYIYLPRVTYKRSEDREQKSREKVFFNENRKFSGERRAHRRKLRSGMKASKLQMLLANDANFYVPDGHTFVKKSVWGKVKMGEREIRYRNKSLNGLFYASDHEIEKAKEIHELSPAGFEERSEKYVAELGWEVTKRNNYDGGIDIRALKEFKDGTIKKLLVQCKHWKKPVGHDVLHALVGAAADEESKYEKVLMVITSSKFTTGAIEYAHNHSITLVRGDDLLKKEA